MTKIKGILLAACLIGFAAIALLVTAGPPAGFDTAVAAWFYSTRTGTLTAVMKGITDLGNWYILGALCAALLLIKPIRKQYGIPVSLTALFASLLNRYLKLAFQRPRPDLSWRLIAQSGYSFPSGHALTSMVVFGLLLYLVRRYVTNKTRANALTALLLIPLIFVGLSRIYLGVHFPTDVLGGWLLGLAIVAAAGAVVSALEKKRGNERL